jgi:hypothetical protein
MNEIARVRPPAEITACSPSWELPTASGSRRRSAGALNGTIARTDAGSRNRPKENSHAGRSRRPRSVTNDARPSKTCTVSLELGVGRCLRSLRSAMVAAAAEIQW